MARACVLVVVWVLSILSPATAGVVTAFYGDDDGFGVGAFSGPMDPNTNNAGPGEAPYTDLRLIGAAYLYPAFAPTGDFTFVLPPGEIVSGVLLTMRAGSWASADPVDGPALPNVIVLDGMTVDSSFIASFVQVASDVEEHSYSLPITFFPLFADGSVSLLGTHLSERSGYGSFQIDFLQLDITTAAVPEPGTFALFGLGLAGLVVWRRKSRRLGA